MNQNEQKIESNGEILIIDDTPANLQLLFGILTEAGYEIRPASNGEAGLEAVAGRAPDLILLDIHMPVMDGFEVCRRLKAEEHSREIPVIFVSAMDDAEGKVQGFRLGAVDYITKPFEPSEVLARVKTHLTIRNTQAKLETANIELLNARDELESLNSRLEERVHQRTAELVNANEALRESKHRLSEAQEIAHIGNWELDLTKNTLYWSDEVHRIYGLTPEQFDATYEAFLEAVHPEDRTMVDSAYHKAVQSNTPYDITHRVVRRDDGQVRYVHERSQEFHDESGALLRSVGTAQDVTALEQANRTLRMFSAVNHALVHAQEVAKLLNQVCRIIVSRGGYRMAWVGFPEQEEEEHVKPVAWASSETGNVESQVVTWVDDDRNPTDMAISTRQPFLLRDILEETSPDILREDARRRGFRAVIALPLILGEEVLGTLTIYAGEEDAFDQENVAQMKDLAGELAFGIHALRARSSLHEHQQHLEELVEERTTELRTANKQLQELDRLKSLFIASMSHELRTPLNSIIGFTGILLQNVIGELNEKQRDCLERVQRSSKHLLGLISDVIDISKVEAGHIDVYDEDMLLDELLQEALGSIIPEAESKGLSVEPCEPTGLTLHTDRQRLMQCVLNFLSNAVKFTESGSVSLSAHEMGDQVEIVVQDSGIGIPEEDQQRLFHPFERLESRLRIKTGGTGLGLYLTKKIIVEFLRGTLIFDSKPGKGSTFGLRIPKTLSPVNRESTEI